MFLLLLLSIFICFFILFVTSRHDFVLIRQNISIRLIFDKAFIAIFFALIMARVFYLVDAKMYDFFLDPLSFFHVILYYGFLIIGFFITLSLSIVLLYKKRKNILRILDIYLLSFYPMQIFVALNYAFTDSINLFIRIGYLVFIVLLFPLLIKMHNGFKIKDGIVSFTILIFSALTYLGYSFLQKQAISIYSPIQIIALISIAVSIYCLILTKINFFQEK